MADDPQRATLSLRPSCVLLLATAGLLACNPGSSRDTGGNSPPNVLWIVWDTVRADRLGLYGHDRSTTPFLEEWAREGRVFTNATSTSCWTVPAHASMFTGLLPSEHGANNERVYLDDEFTTLAELFLAEGYQTYLYSANPHVSKAANFDQGFSLSEHPWLPRYRAAAYRLVAEKIVAQDQSSELPEIVRSQRVRQWDVKASGLLARNCLLQWLNQKDPERPFFAFLNYMEAHRPLVPPEPCRRRVMSDEELARSYQIDRSLMRMWGYTLGLLDYTEEELAVMAATYDAALLELDDLLRDLVVHLRQVGALENTIVVLTSDHGEHLGERHLFDHQFSLYEDLLRVPLVLWWPGHIEAGVEPAPVTTRDLFPTLLELAGLEVPMRPGPTLPSLLAPLPDRLRLAEYGATREGVLKTFEKSFPEHDFERWRRRLRALQKGSHKLIQASTGEQELYDLSRDPNESQNLATTDGATLMDLSRELERWVGALTIHQPKGEAPAMPDEMQASLQALGYLQENEQKQEREGPAPESESESESREGDDR